MPEPFDVLAALIRVDRSPHLAVAARSLAAAGVPVFPCLVEGKRPLTRRGFLDASSDPEQVAAWWSRTPNANIGIPTGAASGVVVVDVDVHGPRDGRVAYQRASASSTRSAPRGPEAGGTGASSLLPRNAAMRSPSRTAVHAASAPARAACTDLKRTRVPKYSVGAVSASNRVSRSRSAWNSLVCGLPVRAVRRQSMWRASSPRA